ncbi:MAG: zinc ribbon domain-containing protein [Oscillospiraceae bacterium]|nr:zinc ribbon domain-containing protein [Oscillospiraceae bacterium]
MAKFCERCGAPLRESDRFCPSCGQPVPTGQSGQDSWRQSRENTSQQSSWSQNSGGQDPWNHPQNSQGRDPWDRPQTPPQAGNSPQSGQPSMAWFKFIIWVQLFLSALTNLASGITIVTGAQYGDYADRVYYVFALLKPLDMVYGLLCIVMGAAALYIRFQLSSFKRRAPALYLGYIAVSIIVPLLYIILASVIIGGFAGDSSTIASLITSVVLLIINQVYFKKRQHLFVN